MEVTGTMVESYLYTVSVTSQKQPPKVFYKKGILENFAKFTGKHLCQSPFFNQVEGQLWHRCFPVNFTKFPRTLFLTEHLGVNASEFRPNKIVFKVSTGT